MIVIFNLVFLLMIYIRGMVDDLHSDEMNWEISLRRNWPILAVDVVLAISTLIGFLMSVGFIVLQ